MNEATKDGLAIMLAVCALLAFCLVVVCKASPAPSRCRVPTDAVGNPMVTESDHPDGWRRMHQNPPADWCGQPGAPACKVQP